MQFELTPDEINEIRVAFRRAHGNLIRTYLVLLTNIDVKEPLLGLDYWEILNDYSARSGIVFHHATLEDLLRSIAAVVLPRCPAFLRDHVPVFNDAKAVDEDGNSKPLSELWKVSLDYLHKHSSITVAQLIEKSVDQYLQRKSFNSYGEIAGFLRGFLKTLSQNA